MYINAWHFDSLAQLKVEIANNDFSYEIFKKFAFYIVGTP